MSLEMPSHMSAPVPVGARGRGRKPVARPREEDEDGSGGSEEEAAAPGSWGAGGRQLSRDAAVVAATAEHEVAYMEALECVVSVLLFRGRSGRYFFQARGHAPAPRVRTW